MREIGVGLLGLGGVGSEVANVLLQRSSRLSEQVGAAVALRRVLVRAPNWVGDAVMSLPVLAGLQRLFPLAGLTVLAASRVAPLFATQPGVTEIIRYPSGRGKWQVLWEQRGRFDVALALPNSMESALGLWLVGVPWGEVVYEFTLDRSGERPLKFLQGFGSYWFSAAFFNFHADELCGQVLGYVSSADLDLVDPLDPNPIVEAAEGAAPVPPAAVPAPGIQQ